MSEDYISSLSINIDGERLYPVEKIVGKRLKKGKVEYLVRWKDYSEDTDSWEPSKSLRKTCHPLIKDFNKFNSKYNNSSIQTSTESSDDMQFNNKKDSDKLCDESNLKSSTNTTSTKLVNSGINFLKNKVKESGRSEGDSEKNSIIIIGKKYNNSNSMIEKSHPSLQVNTKEFLNVERAVSNDTVNKVISEPIKYFDKNTDHKKVVYLEDNEIDEPSLSKLKTSSLNGITNNNYIKSQNLLLSTESCIDLLNNKLEGFQSKPMSFIENILKRNPLSTGTPNSKRAKLSEKDNKVNPISVIENDQIQNLKKLIGDTTLGGSNYFINHNNFRPSIILQPELYKEDKIEKHLKTLPHQRYKESDCFDNSDSLEIRRTSIRQIESANRFREIIVRKNVSAGFTEICLHNQSSTLPNSFNIKILNELYIALKQAINDSSRVILLSAIGSVFSSGIDLESIISCSQKFVSNIKPTIAGTTKLTTPQNSHQHLLDLVESLKKFLLELLNFPKPIIVGINGPAIGLGCAILPLCDLIYATESSSFYLPYTTLSQISEAGSSLTFPVLVGMPTANQLLLCGRKWSAKEALNRGLISEIIFSDKFRAELFSRCEKLAQVPSVSAETMKCMLRVYYKEQISIAINVECRKLVEIWKSNEFRNSAQSFLDNELPKLLL